MKDLIEALQLMSKHGSPDHPTWCSHDEMHVCVDPSSFSHEDLDKLDSLGFFPDDDCFVSFKFGSC